MPILVGMRGGRGGIRRLRVITRSDGGQMVNSILEKIWNCRWCLITRTLQY